MVMFLEPHLGFHLPIQAQGKHQESQLGEEVTGIYKHGLQMLLLFYGREGYIVGGWGGEQRRRSPTMPFTGRTLQNESTCSAKPKDLGSLHFLPPLPRRRQTPLQLLVFIHCKQKAGFCQLHFWGPYLDALAEFVSNPGMLQSLTKPGEHLH